jgi:hypothetical protein
MIRYIQFMRKGAILAIKSPESSLIPNPWINVFIYLLAKHFIYYLPMNQFFHRKTSDIKVVLKNMVFSDTFSEKLAIQ